MIALGRMAMMPAHEHEGQQRAQRQGDQQQHTGETQRAENDVADGRFLGCRLPDDPHDVRLRILHGTIKVSHDIGKTRASALCDCVIGVTV